MSWLSRAANVFRASRVDADLETELQFHHDRRVDDLLSQGLDRATAQSEARRRMGGRLQSREHSRDVKLLPWLESVRQDTAYAVRSLRRQPGFTLVAVLTLATTIGLTTSVVTAFNAVLIKPWPVRDPAGVVTIADAATRSDFSIPQYLFFREQSRSFSGAHSRQLSARARLIADS